MPRYDYVCPECGEESEHNVSVVNRDLQCCDRCSRPGALVPLRRRFHHPLVNVGHPKNTDPIDEWRFKNPD